MYRYVSQPVEIKKKLTSRITPTRNAARLLCYFAALSLAQKPFCVADRVYEALGKQKKFVQTLRKAYDYRSYCDFNI